MRCLLVLTIQLSIFAPSTQADSAWRDEAFRMTGAGIGQREAALKRLQTMPRLDEELRTALRTEDRFLAIDVIGNLRRESMRTELIEFSDSDPTGFSYLALTAFVDSASSREFKKLFLSRLGAPATSPAAKVILLDTLSRMDADPGEAELRRLILGGDTSSVKSAALRFLRSRLLRQPDERDLRLLGFALVEREISQQRLIQALFLVSELAPAQAASFSAPNLDCPVDLPQRLDILCQRIKDRR